MKLTLPQSPVARLLSAFVLIVTALVTAAWYWAPAPRIVPGDLIGEWVSSDPHYDERVFEIDPVSVNFGTPGSKVSVGFIKSVTADPEGARTLYTITYVADKLPSQISFYYDTRNGGSIYFKNRQTVYWTKRP